MFFAGILRVLSVFFKILKDFPSLLKDFSYHLKDILKDFKNKKIKKIFVIVFIIPLPGKDTW